MKTIYVKKLKQKPKKIVCEEFSLSGNFLSTLDKNGDRRYHVLYNIDEICVPKQGDLNG